MSATGALELHGAFKEYIFRCFGAPNLIRHYRDSRFMSKVCQTYAKMMGSKSKATMCYRPQANGQQERSVKTMIHTVRVYIKKNSSRRLGRHCRAIVTRDQ